MDPFIAYVDVSYKGQKAFTSTKATDQAIAKAVAFLKDKLVR